MNNAGTMLVGLRRPPPLAEIAAIPGVTSAQSVEPTLFRIEFANGAEAPDPLVKRAAAGDWGLYQLKPAQTSLEDVFVNLTRREENT